ncbi:MAG: PQQ-dependent sugar dehydrogenase [Pseudomonadota bacterium]|nr:PQQ-dependent sugar dehydrogenase [Pseudomonadota bacterium]
MSLVRNVLALTLLMSGVSACSEPSSAAVAVSSGKPLRFDSERGTLAVTTVAQGLEHPWSLAFLPDGRMLVTERPGRMRLVSATGVLSPPLKNVPEVVARGQGGLLDVVPAPDFAKSQHIYISYSEPRVNGNGTAVARARLTPSALEDLEVIFRQKPDIRSAQHFGSRLAFAADGTLYVTLGDRGSQRDSAQTLDNDLGKVVRIQADGSIPADNPDAAGKRGRPEIWSYGHRNPQGAAVHPQTGKLWLHEHGPKGGDEVNIPIAGRNYGWPVITYGREYSGMEVGDGISKAAGLEQPVHYWVPSIAPSGMAFYTADRFPAWRGNLFVGSLKFGQLVRLELDGDKVTHEERLLDGINRRIRDVRLGPDGYLYLLTDAEDGAILRVGLTSATQGE